MFRGPRPEPHSPGAKRPLRRGALRDLEFRFNYDALCDVQNVIACNLFVDRERALAAGGFDENSSVKYGAFPRHGDSPDSRGAACGNSSSSEDAGVPARSKNGTHLLSRLAVMGRYPKPQRLLIELVYRFGRAFPILAPRKFFRWPEREKKIDELHRAAGIAFVAERVRS